MTRALVNYTNPGSGTPLGVEDLSGAGTGPFWPTNQVGGAAAAEIAAVKNGAPSSSAYGLVTRPLLYDANGVAIVLDSGGRLPVGAVDASASGNITTNDLVNGAAVQGSFVATVAPTVGSFIALNVAGMSAGEAYVGAGSWTAGNIYLEGSLDSTNGSDGNWQALTWSTRQSSPGQFFYLNTPKTGLHGHVGGMKWIRLRCVTAVTSGPVPVVLRASLAPNIESTAPLAGGSNDIGLVRITNAGAVQKATQSAFAVPVQEQKDAGRVNIMWTLEFSPAAVAEALMTMTESRDGAAVTTFTSKIVTSGKRLRISSWNMVVENTLGANPKRAKLRMRFNTAGAVTTASPLQANLLASVATAVNTIGQGAFDDFSDGVEFLGDGTKQIGYTLEFPDWVTAAQTGKVYVTIFAFEY